MRNLLLYFGFDWWYHYSLQESSISQYIIIQMSEILWVGDFIIYFYRVSYAGARCSGRNVSIHSNIFDPSLQHVAIETFNFCRDHIGTITFIYE